jgi:BlaI family penicillinase repressor
MKRKANQVESVQSPTEAELEILAILWEHGASTVREVHSLLQKDTGYTTVLKQMQIMNEKGLLLRSERYKSHLYQAKVAKEKTQQQMTGNLLKRAFDGSIKGLVLGALSSRKVSSQELLEIRHLLDDYERGSK